jgi:hypothetical protein
MTEVKEGVGAVLEQITLVDLCRRAAESQRRHSRALIYEI